MNLLQVFFIISALVLFIISIDFFLKKKINLFNIIILFFWSILLLFFTFFPVSLNYLGHFFWVLNWADVLVYSSIVFLFYIFIILTNKVWDLNINITDLVRETAIMNSKQKILEWEIAFIIPVYNEWNRVKSVISDLINSGFDNLVIINDWSSDNSIDNLKYLENKNRTLILLNHFKNRWQWASLETWFEYIRRFGNISYIATYDSDWQHDISDINKFLKILREDNSIDITIGSRFLKWAYTNIWFIRKIVLKMGIFFTYLTTWTRFTDTHNGYRVFPKETLNKIKITMDRMSQWFRDFKYNF